MLYSYYLLYYLLYSAIPATNRVTLTVYTVLLISPDNTEVAVGDSRVV